ncbi:MAG: HNH endonuclease signature motif containing protein [Gammaproteobacteria bacterium]
MQNRTTIPAEIRRQILVEAGHRCAIQTCRSMADVDIHHIVPWAQSQNHNPDNLIALCPNCHRRADRGAIDRESLRKYKHICQQLARPPHVQDEPRTFIKFLPKSTVAILESSNILSLIDIGTLEFSFGFTEPFNDDQYVTSAFGNGSVSYRVIGQTKESCHVIFEEPCPEIVRLDFRQ